MSPATRTLRRRRHALWKHEKVGGVRRMVEVCTEKTETHNLVVGSRVAKSMSAVKTPALVKLFNNVLLPALV